MNAAHEMKETRNIVRALSQSHYTVPSPPKSGEPFCLRWHVKLPTLADRPDVGAVKEGRVREIPRHPTSKILNSVVPGPAPFYVIDLHNAQQKTIGQSRKTVRWYVFSTWSDRRGLLLVSQANCFRRLTSVRIRSASRAASNGLRKVSLNTERSKPEALSSSLRRPIRTVSVNSEFFRRF